MYRIEPRSDLEFPSTVFEPELVVDRAWMDAEADPGPGRSLRFEHDDRSTIVYTDERDAVFKISNGERVTVDAASVSTDAEVMLNLLGPLLRLVLLQRDEFVLHSSVVDIDGRTAVFMAPSGSGKSTLAAGLYDRGHDVLADDVAVIQLQSNPVVLAGPPVLKLSEESAAHIDRDVRPVFPRELKRTKRFYRLRDDLVPNQTSLDVVYLVVEGDAIDLEPVSARDATVAFVDNAWGLPDQPDEVAAKHFRRCAELAESATVKRLRYPRSFELYDDVLDRIEEDCSYVQ